MKIEKIENLEQIKSLKVGDYLLVHWDEYFYRHHKKCSEIMKYKIKEIKEEDKEIILKVKYNHYFNWEMYLAGESYCNEIYILKSE